MVETAGSCTEAWGKVFVYEYDCILLDIMLPPDHLRQMAAKGKRENMIIISAKDSINDKVEGLELGATTRSKPCVCDWQLCFLRHKKSPVSHLPTGQTSEWKLLHLPQI